MPRQARVSHRSSAIFVPQEMSPTSNLEPGVRVKNEEEEFQTPELAMPNTQSQWDDDEFDEEGEGILANHEGVEYYEDSGFRIKQVSSPTIVQRSLNDLYNLSMTKYLKLDPEYQREVVWDEGRSSALIASVLQGFFIPPIIFNIVSEYEPLNDGSGKKIARYYRICVDGKQRLTSVKKFMDGAIGVSDSSVPPKKWYYRHPLANGVEKPSAHNILPDSTKAFFRTRMFCCYEYSDMPKVIEETMFQLVQRGMPLTPAERMRALSTKWATFGKMFEDDYSMIVNLSKQGRASGFRAVITIFCQILEVMHPSGNKRKNREGVDSKPILQATPQVLTRLLDDDQSLTDAVKAMLKKVFDRFQKLVDASSRKSSSAKSGFIIIPNSAFDPAPDFLRESKVGHVKTFSPIELVATAILLSVHMHTRTDAMLLGDIKEMRYFLRENHKDLRLNNMCWITAWDYIDMEMIRRRGGAEAVPRRNAASARSDGVQSISDDELAMPHAVRLPTRGVGNAGRNSATQPSTPVKHTLQKAPIGTRATLRDKPGHLLITTGTAQHNSPPILAPVISIARMPDSEPQASAPVSKQPRKRNYDIDLGAPPSFRDTGGVKKPRPV